MSYFLTYDDKTGAFSGWCEDTIHAEIPETALPVSDEDYLSLRDELNQGKVLTVVDGKPVVSELPPPDLATLKSLKISQLRFDYEAQRVPLVEFTNKAGFTAEYGARAEDKSNLKEVLDAGNTAWKSNLWLDGKGAPVSPMTFDDLTALAQALDSVQAPTHTRLLQCITDVLDATTSEALDEVTL